MTLGEKITQQLGRAGKSQYDLASFIHRSQSRISKWVSGTGHPTPEDLLGMARFFAVPLEYFCDPALEDPSQVPPPEPVRPETLTAEEQLVWEAVRRLGPEESIRRLIQVGNHPEKGNPGSPPPLQQFGGRTLTPRSSKPERKTLGKR